MDYFSILNLDREPFSNSPDPDFFFQSKRHVECLQKLELALRLKRGLNIVIGAVGSGKTTLCRRLLTSFAADDSIESHLILDPAFGSPLLFLQTIGAMIAGRSLAADDVHGLKEQIKHYLLEKGVDQEKTVVLIIDEGQKLPLPCLEMLRELLNYETNDHKLLQIVVFAQQEFEEVLDRHANLADRVNLIHQLGPMTFGDTRRMIRFRIQQAGSQPRAPELFTPLAMYAIFHATGGYPRKIINLCHQCMLALIVQNRSRVGWRLVRACTHRSLSHRFVGHRRRIPGTVAALAALFVIVGIALWSPVLRSSWISAHDEDPQPAAAFPATPTFKSVVHDQKPIQPTDADQATGLQESQLPAKNLSSDHPGQSVAATAAIQKRSPAPLETQPETSVQTGADQTILPAPSPPTELGAVVVSPRDTLGGMIKTVYGEFRPQYLKAVLDANPHIDKADAIEIGDRITFPAIAMTVQWPGDALLWVRIARAETLQEALQHVGGRQSQHRRPPRRIVAHWEAGDGMQFHIVLAGSFSSRKVARKHLARLPAAPGMSIEIIAHWPEAAIYFSDPLAGPVYNN